jgi:hypothetical protein
VKHGRDPSLENKVVCDRFEGLTIDGMALGLWFSHRGTRCFGAFLKLNANPFTINGLLVSIPGETFNTHGGDVAAEAAKSLEQGDADTCSCGRNGSGQPRRSATDNQYIGVVDNLNISRRFFYFHYDSL